ncbi:MAG: hypothetical protein NTY02_11665 [Acidobacteria bacterium]|nr:hypothetical protein [Acidobacteriota bacterium]
MRLFFALLAVTAVAMSVAGAGLSYDGSYLLFRTLEAGRPWVDHARLTHFLFQIVPSAAGYLTHELAPLVFLFSLGYAAVPLLVTAVCWMVVRRRAPQFFIWCALGTALAALPGQFCLISDMTIVAQMLWPMLAGLLVGLDRRSLWLLLPCAAIAVFSHPAAVAVFGLLSAVAALKAVLRPAERREHLMWGLACVGLMVLAFAYDSLEVDAYEKSLLSLSTLTTSFRTSVAGAPLAAVLLSWIAGLAIVIDPWWLRRRPLGIPGAWPAVCALLAFGSIAIVMGTWGHQPGQWIGAIGFRFFVPAAGFPFVLAAVAEALQLVPQPEDPAVIAAIRSRRRVYANAAAAVCCLTLVTQSYSWMRLCWRLDDTMTSLGRPCQSLDAPEYAWARNTALNHYSITTTSLILRGSRPSAIVMSPGRCADFGRRPGLFIADWHTHPWPGRWFDLSRLQPPPE